MGEQPVGPPRRVPAPVPVDLGPPRSRRGGRVGEAVDALSLAVNVHLTRRHPVSVVHFVTRRCNARCSFCFIDFDHPSPRSAELTVDEIDRLTRTMGPNLSNVNITGGEPFLRGDLIDIARAYYRNAGVRSVYITSNGGFPDRVEQFARTVADEFGDRKLIVSLSIDAFAEEHNRIRNVDGLFDKTLASYRALRAIGGPV
ncbi:MAG: radical SAM protein, partial [Actinomycetes bacterium]